jgi:hypothetical protein
MKQETFSKLMIMVMEGQTLALLRFCELCLRKADFQINAYLLPIPALQLIV